MSQVWQTLPRQNYACSWLFVPNLGTFTEDWLVIGAVFSSFDQCFHCTPNLADKLSHFDLQMLPNKAGSKGWEVVPERCQNVGHRIGLCTGVKTVTIKQSQYWILCSSWSTARSRLENSLAVSTSTVPLRESARNSASFLCSARTCCILEECCAERVKTIWIFVSGREDGLPFSTRKCCRRLTSSFVLLRTDCLSFSSVSSLVRSSSKSFQAFPLPRTLSAWVSKLRIKIALKKEHAACSKRIYGEPFFSGKHAFVFLHVTNHKPPKVSYVRTAAKFCKVLRAG